MLKKTVARRRGLCASRKAVRNKAGRWLDYTAVKGFEKEHDELKLKFNVVALTDTDTVFAVKKVVTTIKENVKENVNTLNARAKSSRAQDCVSTRLHLRPPRPSQYFTGRSKQLNEMREILAKRNSAAITGMGGLGETQLMKAFVNMEETVRCAPGGSLG